jgi:hypothetical protein
MEQRAEGQNMFDFSEGVYNIHTKHTARIASIVDKTMQAQSKSGNKQGADSVNSSVGRFQKPAV